MAYESKKSVDGAMQLDRSEALIQKRTGLNAAQIMRHDLIPEQGRPESSTSALLESPELFNAFLGGKQKSEQQP